MLNKNQWLILVILIIMFVLVYPFIVLVNDWTNEAIVLPILLWGLFSFILMRVLRDVKKEDV